MYRCLATIDSLTTCHVSFGECYIGYKRDPDVSTPLELRKPQQERVIWTGAYQAEQQGLHHLT